MGYNFFCELWGVDLAGAAEMAEKLALLSKKVDTGGGPNWLWAADNGFLRPCTKMARRQGIEGERRSVCRIP